MARQKVKCYNVKKYTLSGNRNTYLPKLDLANVAMSKLKLFPKKCLSSTLGVFGVPQSELLDGGALCLTRGDEITGPSSKLSCPWTDRESVSSLSPPVCQKQVSKLLWVL